MKKLLAIALAIVSIISLSADEKSKKILNQFSTKLNGYASYGVDFTASISAEAKNIRGKFIVNGKKFTLNVYDMEVYSDGITMYNYSKDENEVTIEEVDPNDPNLFSNPARIFALYDKDFAHTYKGEREIGGKICDVIELKPNDLQSYTDIVLTIDRSTMWPVQITYYSAMDDSTVDIKVSKFTPNIPVKAEMFKFDPRAYQGLEIIDFR